MTTITDRLKVILFVTGRIHQLVKDKLISNAGKVRLRPAGVSEFDQLEASGFRPTRDEVRRCLLAVIGSPLDKDTIEATTTLVLHYHEAFE